jgi:hypothetical protein
MLPAGSDGAGPDASVTARAVSGRDLHITFPQNILPYSIFEGRRIIRGILHDFTYTPRNILDNGFS